MEMAELGTNIKRLIFDLLIFNGSLPQILANPVLKEIYNKEWLENENLRNRAMFLRLRMKVLAEKDTQIFEDDDKEYGELKKYSMGQSVKDINKDGGQYHYYKDAVSVEIQNYFDPRETELAAQISQIGPIANPSDLEESVRVIFEATGSSANDDSVANFETIDYEPQLDDVIIPTTDSEESSDIEDLDHGTISELEVDNPEDSKFSWEEEKQNNEISASREEIESESDASENISSIESAEDNLESDQIKISSSAISDESDADTKSDENAVDITLQYKTPPDTQPSQFILSSQDQSTWSGVSDNPTNFELVIISSFPAPTESELSVGAQDGNRQENIPLFTAPTGSESSSKERQDDQVRRQETYGNIQTSTASTLIASNNTVLNGPPPNPSTNTANDSINTVINNAIKVEKTKPQTSFLFMAAIFLFLVAVTITETLGTDEA